jgi:hypothetical protein
MESGWLTFEADEDRRRLAPIPEGWDNLPDGRLELLLKVAVAVPRVDPSQRRHVKGIPRNLNGAP